jgi:tellurite resistance protein TerC
LVDRLVYLVHGLAVILAFIGVKLVFEALATNELPFINGGQPLHLWEPPITVSLGVIVGTMAVVVVASRLKTRALGRAGGPGQLPDPKAAPDDPDG